MATVQRLTPPAASSRRLIGLLCAAVIPLAVFALLAPTLHMALVGDDYEWIQYTRRVPDRPDLFFSRMGNYFRPSTTLVFLIDRALWGINPLGYRLDNLLVHSANGILLLLASMRLRLHHVTALCVALLWVTSPYSIEIATQPAMLADALLALGLLGLAAAWPRSGEDWSRARIALAGVSTAMAICSKETWVVTPAIALVLERFHHGSSWRKSLRAMAPFLIALVAYLVLYLPTEPREQWRTYEYDIAPMAKIPHLFSAFLQMQEPVPVGFPVGWKGLLATLVVLLAGWYALRSRSAPGALGLCLLLLPLIPVALIPYMPTRYIAIPYLGFLLLAASLAETAAQHSRWVTALLLALAGLVGIAGLNVARAEVADYARISERSQRLLDEARRIVDVFPIDVPVLFLRAESRDICAELAQQSLGLNKVYYVRGADPYGLIETSALIEYVGTESGIRVENIQPGDPATMQPVRAKLVHRLGGFFWLPAGDTPAADLARSYQKSVHGVRLIRARVLTKGSSRGQ
ncbi:MAG: hypothetical protein AB1714_11590 [Acidobacteriota bacterium]